jgi:hypothetical protein
VKTEQSAPGGNIAWRPDRATGSVDHAIDKQTFFKRTMRAMENYTSSIKYHFEKFSMKHVTLPYFSAMARSS